MNWDDMSLVWRWWLLQYCRAIQVQRILVENFKADIRYLKNEEK